MWESDPVPKTMDRGSQDDFLIPVTLLIAEGANPSPTEDAVSFAFTIGGLPVRFRPTENDWLPGFWLQSNGLIYAGILIGPPLGTILAPGRWTAWIRVTDNPTAPQVAVDVLTIT